MGFDAGIFLSSSQIADLACQCDAEALQLVQKLFLSRGQRTYFDSVKQPVEEACGRRFTVRPASEHLHTFSSFTAVRRPTSQTSQASRTDFQIRSGTKWQAGYVAHLPS